MAADVASASLRGLATTAKWVSNRSACKRLGTDLIGIDRGDGERELGGEGEVIIHVLNGNSTSVTPKLMRADEGGYMDAGQRRISMESRRLEMTSRHHEPFDPPKGGEAREERPRSVAGTTPVA